LRNTDLGFLDETQGDILNNFNSDAFEANAGRGLLAVTMFFTYPMEAFVARHVLVKLIYNGDMDGEQVGPNGETIPEAKHFGFLGRREILTLAIYVATLIPALIVNDLGPVLSLTGSLGASCIAYIGPGLVYLGINGGDFLIYTAKMLEDKGYKTNKTSENGGIELPVVGVTGLNLQTPTPEASYPEGLKPWWWYVGGFPIWCAIASSGALGTRTFMAGVEADIGSPLQSPSEDESDEVIGPCRRDYYISMFFIIFGVVAMVVGVATNIYGTYRARKLMLSGCFAKSSIVLFLLTRLPMGCCNYIHYCSRGERYFLHTDLRAPPNWKSHSCATVNRLGNGEPSGNDSKTPSYRTWRRLLDIRNTLHSLFSYVVSQLLSRSAGTVMVS
jgi:hypothetical protein